jgi:hypothetical protein
MIGAALCATRAATAAAAAPIPANRRRIRSSGPRRSTVGAGALTAVCLSAGRTPSRGIAGGRTRLVRCLEWSSGGDAGASWGTVCCGTRKVGPGTAGCLAGRVCRTGTAAAAPTGLVAAGERALRGATTGFERGVAIRGETGTATAGLARTGADPTAAGNAVGEAGVGEATGTAAGATAAGSRSTAADAAGAGGGAWTGSGAAAGWAEEAAARAGRSPTGSTYPSGSAATRIPRWTCGAAVTGSALSPTRPTTSPSSTVLPRTTSVAPSWSSVTAKPSVVWIVTALPPPGTGPTNETTPPAAACTAAPTSAPTSTPRC